jgi:hypothetical protein
MTYIQVFWRCPPIASLALSRTAIHLTVSLGSPPAVHRSEQIVRSRSASAIFRLSGLLQFFPFPYFLGHRVALCGVRERLRRVARSAVGTLAPCVLEFDS